MKLRPHHLLCTRAFTGKGYSEAFVKNMQDIIRRLREGAVVELQCGPDDICAACPEHTGDGCKSEEKVCRLDADTIANLWLVKEKYTYAEIEEILQDNLDETVYAAICSECEWHKSGVCTYECVMRKLS
jgi:Uncharacterized conserved protein